MPKRSLEFTESSSSKMSKPTTKPKVFKKKYQSKFSSHKLANFIKKVINQKAEHKEVNVYNPITTAPLNATQYNIYLINGAQEGTDYNQRVGRAVTSMYIECTVTVVNRIVSATNALGYGDAGFWCLVFDRNPEGALPVFADIFDQSSAAATPAPGMAFRSSAINQDRFQILSREEWAVGCNNYAGGGALMTSSGAVPYHIKKHVDLTKILRGKDKTTNYNTTTSVIAAIDAGAIYFVIAGSFSTANDFTYWAANTKYRFVDV